VVSRKDVWPKCRATGCCCALREAGKGDGDIGLLDVVSEWSITDFDLSMDDCEWRRGQKRRGGRG